MKVGIDLGGSHIAIGVVDNKGKIVEKTEKRLLNNEKKHIEKTIEDNILEYIKELSTKYKIEDGAVNFLIEQAEKYGKKLTIVPIGPLTNIASAIEKAPQSMKKISKIVLMGGYFSKTDPEWNILVDPKAAEIVFNSGIELYAVGLDVTLQCTLKEDLLKDFRNSSKAVNKVLTLWLDRWFKRYGLEKSVMHDPLAIASLNGDVCVFEKKFVKVLLEGKRGTTLVSDKKEEGFSPVFVAVSVNSEKFYSLVRQYLL